MSLDVEALYREHHRGIGSYFTKRLWGVDPTVVDDMVADVFERACKAAPRYRDRGVHPKAWLYRIAINRLTDYYRDEKWRAKVVYLDDTRPPYIDHAGTDDHLARIDAQMVVTAALASFRVGNSFYTADKQIAVIRARYLEGGTDAEVAQRLGMTTDVVKKLRRRALLNLRKTVGAA